MSSIVLPWPPKELSPNARPHFMAKSRATKKAREWARLATLADRPFPPRDGPIKVILGFYPPTAHDRDKDNLLASSKAYLDGIATALGVNDKRFDPSVVIGEPVKHGKVIVEIIEQEARQIGDILTTAFNEEKAA